MLIQRLKSGDVLVEINLRDFRDYWKTAGRDDKVVLDDRRPAVRVRKQNGDTALYTLHPLAWDIAKKRFQELIEAGQLTPSPKTKLCAFCGSELTVSKEMHDLWVMVCKNCTSMATMSKSLEGGTRGQGEKE
ncbi:MAG: hypothetical protein ACRCZI_11390 [Cetobacterium sp.]